MKRVLLLTVRGVGTHNGHVNHRLVVVGVDRPAADPADTYEWRTDLYDDVGGLLNENTRSGAVDASAEFTREMIHNLELAMDHPDMTPELAALLSTSQVELEYEIHSGVEVRD